MCHQQDRCRRFQLSLAELTEQDHDAGHLAKGATHGDKASSDFIPTHGGHLLERVGDHLNRFRHGDEHDGVFDVELIALADALHRLGHLEHGDTDTGKTLGQIFPAQLGDLGHRIGKHIDGLRHSQHNEGRFGDTSGIIFIHGLAQRFHGEAQIGGQRDNGAEGHTDLIWTHLTDFAQGACHKHDCRCDFDERERPNTFCERNKRIVKITKNGLEAGRRCFGRTHGLCEEPADRFGNSIKRLSEFLGRHEDAATGQASENISKRELVADPSGDLADRFPDLVKHFERFMPGRATEFSKLRSECTESLCGGTDPPSDSASDRTQGVRHGLEHTDLADRLVDVRDKVTKGRAPFEERAHDALELATAKHLIECRHEGLKGLLANIEYGKYTLEHALELVQLLSGRLQSLCELMESFRDGI